MPEEKEASQTDDIVDYEDESDELDQLESSDSRLYMSNMYNLLRSIQNYPESFLSKENPLNPYK